MKTCTILLSYIERWTPEYIRAQCAGADLIVCADAGQKIARKSGIEPDIVIGDFDSTGEFIRFDCPYITYPVEKDLTDTEACLEYVTERGYEDIRLIGGIGGRLDHTLGNLALLLRFYAPGRRIRLIDPVNSAEFLQSGSLVLPKDPSLRFFSLVPVDEQASGVTITGAKYGLKNGVVRRASTMGISNEVTDEEAVVSVGTGGVFVIRSQDQ